MTDDKFPDGRRGPDARTRFEPRNAAVRALIDAVTFGADIENRRIERMDGQGVSAAQTAPGQAGGAARVPRRAAIRALKNGFVVYLSVDDMRVHRIDRH